SRARLQAMQVPPEIKELENKIEQLRKEKESYIKIQDFEKAASLRDEERTVRDQLDKIRQEWTKQRDNVTITLGEEDIARVVSQWTRIPLIRLEQKESEKLLKMEDSLRKLIIGQEEAISAIARAVRRSRAGIKNPRRPIGSFIFLGPTGVGKTHLARMLTEFMFGDADAMIQIDMSEYMDKFNVSRLIGAPPGYVGYEEGGQLTEKVRRKPYSVILLDEIEKAHPDVFNLLLQVLEEGRLTDSLGRKVDFRNTIILMTSNVGAEMLRSRGALGFVSPKGDATYIEMKNRLLEEAKKVFKPEFLNRIDDIIVFKSLTRDDLYKIVDLEIQEVSKRLKEKGIKVELTQEAIELLIEKGFDPVFGARPLKRTIQRYLEDPLAEEIISGEYKEGSKIKVGRKEEVLAFQ
ncbi:MAG: ATP-dependent Clp protease ATP-binding subunit, partial [Candidatus Omnitrophica bacterium]|nr:ATP-dependent Clp protease ATP-binding subunit [Candidatus Omnitrophota bacterium]